MNIQIINVRQGTESTLSSVLIDTVHMGWVLQDQDRGLRSNMPLSEIGKIKVHGRTAIPAGRYQVAMTYSSRFGRIMPQLLNVPGFDGIRIHAGNTIFDTEGCLLPGIKPDQDKLGYWRVWESRNTLKTIVDSIEAAELRKEAIWCEVSRVYTVPLVAIYTNKELS